MRMKVTRLVFGNVMTQAVSPGTPGRAPADASGIAWLSHHAHVVLCIARDPGMRLREMAGAIGITERAVIHLVADLERVGLLSRDRQGRRNRYTLHGERALGHPFAPTVTVQDLIRLLVSAPSA
jgi:hypothetical protein